MTHEKETWKSNESEQSEVKAVKMRAQEAYRRFGMAEEALRVNLEVSECVNRSGPRWCGHIRRMPEERMVEKSE